MCAAKKEGGMEKKRESRGGGAMFGGARWVTQLKGRGKGEAQGYK